MASVIIEVCCGSAEDVFTAQRAGAHRVELNAALALGGLTPSLGTMEQARQASLPIMAMVRPRAGGFCYSEGEFRTMLADARALLAAGADGIVFGLLTPDGRVDVPRCREMLAVIGEKESVFSRAMDVVPDWREGLDALMELGVTRVLTSGQAPTAPQGAAVLRSMAEYAAGRIQILPGCGVRPDNAAALLAATGCDQLHGSFQTSAPDLAAGTGPVSFAAPGGALSVTDPAALRALAAALAQK